MAEKVVTLSLQRDYTKFLYFIDGNGSVCSKPKGKGDPAEKETIILVQNAVQRDNKFLYFIDKDGDIARSPRVERKKKTDEPVAAPETSA